MFAHRILYQIVFRENPLIATQHAVDRLNYGKRSTRLTLNSKMVKLSNRIIFLMGLGPDQVACLTLSYFILNT